MSHPGLARIILIGGSLKVFGDGSLHQWHGIEEKFTEKKLNCNEVNLEREKLKDE